MIALLGLVLVVAVVVRLALLLACDGLGSNPSPRSHRDELGTWADRRLLR